MRLHTLRLRGVGPFKDEFTIDFDDLGGQRLFLIDGDTGTGKSTVIDAIVFALFGRTADDDAGDRMVSDFLPTQFTKADRPFVELVFTVESGVYQVRREPKYTYTNRNGKEALQNPTIRLERLANETSENGQVISTSLQEGNAEIQRVVQLNSGQFLATVVLAQGQFATFLRAGPDQRREILERVFGTEAYRRVEQELKERKSAATGERNAAAGRCQDAAARFHEVAEVDVSAVEWRESATREPARVVALAEARAVEVGAAAQEATAQRDVSAQAKEVADKALADVQQRAALVREKRQLLAERATLAQAETAIDTLRQALTAHAKARTVEPYRAARAKAAKEVASTTAAADRCWRALDPVEAALAQESDSDVAVSDAITELAAEEGRLTPLRQLEQSLPTTVAALAASADKVESLESEGAATARAAAQVPSRLVQLREDVAERTELAASADSREAQIGVVASGLAAARSAADVAGRHNAALARLDEATAALDQARDAAHRIETAYHADIAGVLAKQLQPGEPCPVCGGLEHPSPTSPAADEVTRKAVSAARATVDVRQAAAEIARSQVEAFAGTLAAAQALSQGREVAAWEADLAIAEAALEEALRARREAAELTERVTELEAERTRLETKGHQLAGLIAAVRAEHEQRSEQLARDRADVAAARAQFDSVADRVADVHGRLAALRAWQQARSAASRAQAVALEAADGLSSALAEAGFATEDDVAAAVLPAGEEGRHRASVAAHEKRWVQIEGRLEATELAALDADESVDVDGPASVAAAAATALASANAAATLAQKKSAVTESTLKALRTAADDLIAVAGRVAPVIRMADIVNGTGANSLSIPLSQYVVLRRFQDVLEAANSRLLAISDGRYRLEPDTTARHGQKVRRGLGLRIVDERTEQARDVATLSGGETFYTSLSLALGLADVVQQEAGGVQMRTLFVDEGFGSLDTETLEAVMAVLGTLSRGDRMVGVISHVTEMKHSIPFRIHVQRPDRDGPSVIVTPS
ncbi:MAG: repair protein SbcC/Rad50 [Actinomycetota bacterium]|nr:repair protein SbcC/Rad50 [Actinomycetota bacterium]